MDWGRLAPALARFYGGTPYEWLTQVPVAIVRSSLAMMPVLYAEEAMRQAEAIGVGHGTMDPRASRHIVERWRASAGVATAPVRSAATTLPVMGIGYTVVGPSRE